MYIWKEIGIQLWGRYLQMDVDSQLWGHDYPYYAENIIDKYNNNFNNVPRIESIWIVWDVKE